MDDARVWGLDLDAAARLLVTEVRDGATSTRVRVALRDAYLAGRESMRAEAAIAAREAVMTAATSTHAIVMARPIDDRSKP